MASGTGAKVKNLGVVDVNDHRFRRQCRRAGGVQQGTVTQCYSTGVVSGGAGVGGLVGEDGGYRDPVLQHWHGQWGQTLSAGWWGTTEAL